MRKSLSKYLFFIGIGIFIISYLLPVDFFENFTNLRPPGIIFPLIMFINSLI